MISIANGDEGGGGIAYEAQFKGSNGWTSDPNTGIAFACGQIDPNANIGLRDASNGDGSGVFVQAL